MANSDGSNDPNRPHSWNRYAYVTGDPVNLLDPNGTCGTPSESYTKADGTIGISVSIPCSAYPTGFFRLPIPTLTVADYDDFHGLLPKCPKTPILPAGISPDQLQLNIDDAHRVLDAQIAAGNPNPLGDLFGYFTGNFLGAWNYKDQYQLGTTERQEGQDFGNFNFGAVSASSGFSYSFTQNAAGVAQIGICLIPKGACGTGIPVIQYPFGDQISDAVEIKRMQYENTVTAGCKP